ncbi:hypothetical protein TWF281_011872 [Arthrobotrys megalospora]
MTKPRKRKVEELEFDYLEQDVREKELPPWKERPSKPLQRRRVHRGLRVDGGTDKKNHWEYSNSPPSDRWLNDKKEFAPPSSQLKYFTSAERKERRRASRVDFASRNSDYILRLCEKARGGYWKCQVDEDERILVGCRNYIVTLLFDDGTKWLLKTGQPDYEWSMNYITTPDFLIREIATNLWVYENTGVPVPRIRLWDTRTSGRNKFGQPWYVMQKVEGETVYSQMEISETTDPGFDGARKEMEIHRHMAQFDLEFLRYPSSIEGSYRLKKKAKFFHGSEKRPLHVVKLRKKPSVTGPSPGLVSDFLGAVGHCRAVLGLNSKYWDPNSNEETLHKDVFNYLEEAISKIIDPRFEHTYYLIHGDITENNILCDRAFQITGIIDWELAKTVPLQDAITQPSTTGNQLLRIVPRFLEKTGDYKKTTKAWKGYDRENQIFRDNFILAVDQLDDSILGDEATPWTAGYKYVTGLYRIAHSFHMMCFFINDYQDLLDQEPFVRMFVLAEIKKIAERAVELVENDGVLIRTGP